MFAGPLARAIGRVDARPCSGRSASCWLHPERLPVTRFNSEVSPHRVFESRRFFIDEFKRIRDLVPGATINDAVLAVCGGALRRYLLAHEELPGAEPGLARAVSRCGLRAPTCRTRPN